jgi:predicted HD phosphohydrolase
MSYTRMDQMTAEDLAQEEPLPVDQLLERLISQLETLRGLPDGVAELDRFTHSLQTATRCMRDRSSTETVVCALLHDMAYTIAPCNHAEVAAGMLRPYVSEENWWVVKHHDVFQTYYYFHLQGKDRAFRNAYRGHPYFRAGVRFCARWDQRSFDPAYPTEPLDTFVPLLREVFGRPPADLVIRRD